MFPTPILSGVTNGTTATATPTVNLPTTISEHGRKLLVSIHRCAVAGAIGWPANWVELYNASGDAADDVISIAYKWILSSDGGNQISLTQGNGKFANLMWLIAGAEDPSIRPPELSTIAIGTTTPVNPTTVTPTGGVKNYLWLWLGGWGGEQTSPPATAPTGYSTPMIGANSGTAGAVTTNVRVASAWKNATAASEDPPTVAISATASGWSGWGMAIHPASPMKFAAINHQNPGIV